MGFFTETTGSLRNLETRRTPSYACTSTVQFVDYAVEVGFSHGFYRLEVRGLKIDPIIKNFYIFVRYLKLIQNFGNHRQ